MQQSKFGLPVTATGCALIVSAVSLVPGGDNLAQGYSVQRDFLSNITYNHAFFYTQRKILLHAVFHYNWKKGQIRGEI